MNSIDPTKVIPENPSTEPTKTHEDIYAYILDKDISRTDSSRGPGSTKHANLERESRLSVLNVYNEIDEYGNKRQSVEAPNNDGGRDAGDIESKIETSNTKEAIPDDYSLAGPCVTPSDKQSTEKPDPTVDSDAPYAEISKPTTLASPSDEDIASPSAPSLEKENSNDMVSRARSDSCESKEREQMNETEAEEETMQFVDNDVYNSD